MNTVKDIPKTVRVGPHKYPVRIVKELKNSKDEYCWGLYDFKAHLISLDRELSRGRMQEVLLHEVIHAIWETGDLPNGDVEEKVISVFTPLLLSVIRDNPELMRFLR